MAQESRKIIQDFALQGIMNVHLNPFDWSVTSYFIAVGKKHNLLRIIEHILKYFDNPEYVKINYSPDGTDLDRKDPTLFLQFNVHKDDIDKISSDAPIRVKCLTDASFNNQESFINFLNDLDETMQY